MGKNQRAGDEIRTHDNHVGNVVLYQLSYTRRAVPQTSVHRLETRTGTHCLGTPDYKGPGGGRKVILWGNRVFWGEWADEFGNRCRLINMSRAC